MCVCMRVNKVYAHGIPAMLWMYVCVCVCVHKVYAHGIPAMLWMYVCVCVCVHKVYAHGNCFKAMHVCACMWTWTRRMFPVIAARL